MITRIVWESGPQTAQKHREIKNRIGTAKESGTVTIKVWICQIW